jgi:hypothetical protein
MAFGIGGPMQRISGGDGPSMGGRNPAVPGGGEMQSFKKGGKVKKTGLAKVEKGEKVLTKKQQSSKKLK